MPTTSKHAETSETFVFSVTGGTAVSGFSKAKRLLDARMQELAGASIEPWRLHDLRRTAATGMQRIGTNLQVIEAVLGHVAGSRAGVVGVYQRHSFEAEKKMALEAWSAEIARIADGEVATVIPITKKRA